MNSIITILPLLALASAQYTATYDPLNLPSTSQQDQSGTNACGTTASQTSNCQNLYVNSVEDFCLWGPPATTSDEGDGTSKIGNVEQIVVSYCLNDGYGTRLIPSGTITSAHFAKVESENVSYVQVRGTGDFTSMNIPANDDGGELDPHSWTGLGNPQGGLAFTNAFGAWEETHEWTSFMSADSFCVRLCRDGPNAPGYCQHIYDTLSCDFTIPGATGPGFDNCQADAGEQPGVYDGTTFSQGDPTTPAVHPPASSSMCTSVSTIGGSSVALGPVTQNAAVSVSGSASTASSGAVSSGSASSPSSGPASSASITSAAASALTTAPMSASASMTTSRSSASRAAASASASPSGGASRNAASLGVVAAAAGVAVVLL